MERTGEWQMKNVNAIMSRTRTKELVDMDGSGGP